MLGPRDTCYVVECRGVALLAGPRTPPPHSTAFYGCALRPLPPRTHPIRAGWCPAVFRQRGRGWTTRVGLPPPRRRGADSAGLGPRPCAMARTLLAGELPEWCQLVYTNTHPHAPPSLVRAAVPLTSAPVRRTASSLHPLVCTFWQTG